MTESIRVPHALFGRLVGLDIIANEASVQTPMGKVVTCRGLTDEILDALSARVRQNVLLVGLAALGSGGWAVTEFQPTQVLEFEAPVVDFSPASRAPAPEVPGDEVPR